MNLFKNRESKASRGLFAAIDVLPLLLPTALTAFGVVAMILLLIGQLKDIFVWPLGAAAAGAASWAVWRYARISRPGELNEQRIGDILMIIAVVLWGGWNILFTSQHVLTNRDPATYAVAGAWLVHHDSLQLKITDVFGDTPRITGYSAGFNTDKEKGLAYAQGQHLLPAMLGLGGRVLGDTHMLRLNVLIGVAALMAVYAFARLLVRPRWALVATGALAVSLPMIYFSRDTYTEPLALMLTFTALALLWIGQKMGSLPLWFLAGLAAGAGTLTRVDGYLTIAGLTAVAGVWTALSAPKHRRLALQQVGLLALGAGITGVLGFFDLSLLSAKYFEDVLPLLKQEILVIVALVFAGAIVTALAWRTDLLKKLDAKTRNWRAPVTAIVLALIALVLISRPIWFVSYTHVQNGLIAGLQAAVGDPVEPRNYTEQTTNWVAWYLGPILAALGAVGVIVAAAWAMARRDLLLLAALAVIIMTSLVYFIRPSITPDQVWGSRRYLPVIMPGLAIFGVLMLDKLNKTFFDRHRYEWVFVVLIGIGVIIAPLAVTRPFVKVRENTQLASVRAICDQLPKNAAVLWMGTARLEMLQPTRAFCGFESAGYTSDHFKVSHLAMAAKAAREHGKVPYIGIYNWQGSIFEGRGLEDFHRINDNSYPILQQTIHGPPRHHGAKKTTLLMAELLDNGKVAPPTLRR